MELKYTVKVMTSEGECEINGSDELESTLHLIPELPLGKMLSAEAFINISVKESEHVFMNGFQSWTYSPEYTVKDRIRGLSHLPKAGIRYFGLDRYGDYYFHEYPNKEGILHGVSYCYFRDGDEYRLFASLEEKPGYTFFTYDHSSGTLKIERDCKGVKCKGYYPVFGLFYASGSEKEVFDNWFKAMDIKARTKEKTAGYCSWYNRYRDINENFILNDLYGCKDVLKKGDVFQIDDGWQPFVGDWLETDKEKFPHGLRPLSDKIHEYGFKAGLWLAPYVAEKKSKVYKEHPDWLYKHEGKNWYLGNNWSGFYSLDFDKEEVRDYLKECFRRVFEEWNFDLVKLDFLYGAAPFGDENESRAGRMIRAVDYLRTLCGDKLILGCGVPLMPAFGRVDYCRIGPDVSLDWNDSRLMQKTVRERPSTRQTIGNTIFRRQLSGRAWLNDPDVFILRDDNVRLKEEEKKALAEVNSLFGGVLFNSDNMASYSDEKLKFYEELLLNREAEDIEVHNEKQISIKYKVKGERKTLILPDYE